MTAGFDPNVPKMARMYDYLLGGCNQPAVACEVHHVKHKANGGKTSTKDCVLLCFLCRYRHNQQYADIEIMPT